MLKMLLSYAKDAVMHMLKCCYVLLSYERCCYVLKMLLSYTEDAVMHRKDGAVHMKSDPKECQVRRIFSQRWGLPTRSSWMEL